jgi:putative DNA methylase
MACPFCDERIAGRLPAASNGNFTFIPVACCLGTSDGKLYVPYSGDALPFESYIVRELSAIGAEIPETELPRWSGIVNPTVYGIVRHSDLFSPRQLVVLLMLIRSLRDLYAEILRERGLAVARAVIACLSGFIDQLVDWNSAFSVWLPTNAQVGRSLAGPGLPMQWAFVEIDPFSRGPANLWDKLERIVQACEAIPRFRQRPTVIAGSATQLDLPTASIDAIVTDPPYADNLYYSVLADCIYVWKRLCLRDIFPAEFSQASSPTEPELVASTRRHGGSAAAMAFYRDGLRASLAEGYRVLKPGGVLSLIFTHSTLDGWTALFSAILAAGFRVVTCWPFTIERKARPRGLAKGAVHASCVIVAIKAEGEATAETSTEPGIALSALRTSLKQDGWSQAEIGLALFVKRVGWQLGRASTLSYEQISAVVAECYRQTHEATPDFSLKTRNML